VTVSFTSVGAITLFVDDPRRSQAFYERVFGRSPAYEDETSAAFDLDNTIVNLVVRSAGGAVVEPRAVAGPDVGSQLMLTVWVDDADAACEELSARGVDLLNGPVDRPWGVRTAAFADPDGHVWEVAQQLSQQP
jgi:catechol 2,3-dioxygenase-like lactoylglutathione lyase family enzyme